MSKVNVGFKELSAICGAAYSPAAALKFALEWAEKAEAVGLGQQARADELEQQLAALREAAQEIVGWDWVNLKEEPYHVDWFEALVDVGLLGKLLQEGKR